MAAPPALDLDQSLDPETRLKEIARGRLLIRQSETERALSMSSDMLAQEIEAGRLKYVLVGNARRRRFKPVDLLQYIQQQERGGCPNEDDRSSNGARSGSPGVATSTSTVVDFETALAQTKPKPKPQPPRSTPRLLPPPRPKVPKLRRKAPQQR